MRLTFALWFLQISSSLGCPTINNVMNETIFKNIIADGKWHVSFQYRDLYDKSLDPMVDTALYTEMQFFDGFPVECRIRQHCFEHMTFKRTFDFSALVTVNKPGLNFYMLKNDSALVENYAYAIYKYEPNRLLILYTCTPYVPNDQYGLLVLHKVDAKSSFGLEVELESVLADLRVDGIFANETKLVYLDERLPCPQRYFALQADSHFERNAGEKNPRGNWRIALANLLLGRNLLQIYRN